MVSESTSSGSVLAGHGEFLVEVRCHHRATVVGDAVPLESRSIRELARNYGFNQTIRR